MEIALLIVIVLQFFIIIKNSKKIFAKNDSYKNINKSDLLRVLEDAKNQGIEQVDDLLESILYTGEGIKVHEPIQEERINTDEEVIQKPQLQVQNPRYYKAANKDDETKYPSKYYVSNEDKQLLDFVKTPIEQKHSFSFEKFALFGKILFGVVIGTLIVGALIIYWNQISDQIKSLSVFGILIISFILSSFYSASKNKLPHFLHIFTLLLFPLSGFFVWNSFTIEFNTFWFYFSAFLVPVYGISYYALKFQNSVFLFLASIYSLFISLILYVTNNQALTILLITLQNLAIYLFSGLLFKKNSTAKNITRVLNQVLNILAIALVLNNASNLAILSVAALFLPSIFEVIAYFKDKAKLDFIFTLFLLPAKLYLVAYVLKLNINHGILMFLGMLVFLTIFFIFKNKSLDKIILSVGNAIQISITLILTSILVLTNEYIKFFVVDPYIQTLTVTVLFFNLLLGSIAKKNYRSIALTLVYLIAVMFQINSAYSKVQNVQTYFVLLLGLLAFSFVCDVFVKRLKTLTELHKLFLPLLIISFLLTALFAVLTLNPLIIFFSFLIFGLISLGYSYIYKLPNLRILIVYLNMVIFTSGLFVLGDYGLIRITNLSIAAMLAIPILIYGIVWEVERKQKKIFIPELIGFISFSVLIFGYFVNKIDYLFALSIVGLIYALYSFKFKKSISVYLLFGFSNIALFLGLSIINASTYSFTTYFAILNFVLIAISQVFENNLNIFGKVISKEVKELFGKLTRLSVLIMLLVMPLNIFLYLNDIPGENKMYLHAACVVSTFGLLLASKISYFLQDFAGVPALISIFSLVSEYKLNYHFYILPIFIYLVYLSFVYKSQATNSKTLVFAKQAQGRFRRVFHSDPETKAKVLRYSAFFIEFTILAIQSVYEHYPWNIYLGILLLAISFITLIYGIKKKDKFLTVLSLFAILVEGIIRLYVVLAGIPIWTYLILAFLIAFDLTMIVLWRSEKKHH